MLTVGLTGNVASGKSTVAKLWADAGVPLVSADVLAREVVEPGTEGLGEVVDAFGRDVLAEDGSLDRAALRDRVFRDETARRRLEALLHPRIRAQRDAWVREQQALGTSMVVAEIPLLFESGYHTEFDETVLVHASEPVRLDRLVRLRGLPRDEARRIMESQMEAEAKLAMADHVLMNDGDKKTLCDEAMELLDRLRTRAGDDAGRVREQSE